jgi:hypothetical protein
VFGPPGTPGALDGRGSPRWKQRALYDAVKDITGLESRTLRFCRLSVWDRIGDLKLGDALAGAAIDLDELGNFIARRTL